MPPRRRRRGRGIRPRRRRWGRGKRKMTFSTFVYRILKLMHPSLGITGKSMKVINSFIADIYDRLMEEGGKLYRIGRADRSNILSSRDLQGATRLVLPGSLAKHAMGEGSKAVTKYLAYKRSLRRNVN